MIAFCKTVMKLRVDCEALVNLCLSMLISRASWLATVLHARVIVLMAESFLLVLTQDGDLACAIFGSRWHGVDGTSLCAS